MSELFAKKLEQKKDWVLTRRALERLLVWLDGGVDSEGEKYEEMRRRLVAYFDRKNCTLPDELADETLNRVARRLEEEGAIESETPARYCYIVARFVFMEHLREEQKGSVLLGDIRRNSTRNSLSNFAADDEKNIKERMLNCLGDCTGKLKPLNREIITRYYTGKERVKIENRRALAASLNLTMNALAIRACRLRDKLEVCVSQCLRAE